MDSDSQPLDSDRSVTLALEMSSLRDEIETLGRRRSGTLRAGIALTVLFLVAGMFMDKTGTLWFLGAMWLFLTVRLRLINRTSEREMRIKEAALESLANPSPGGALPHGP